MGDVPVGAFPTNKAGTMATIAMGKFPIDDGFVTLREVDHRYFDRDGEEYESWSSVIKGYTEPFNAKQVASNLSGGNAAKRQALLQEWDDIRDEACEYGHDIHAKMEMFWKYGDIDPELANVQLELQRILGRYEQICSERTVYMRWNDRLFAGQSDKILVRPRRNIIDIDDYKTNRRHGIRTQSGKVMADGTWKFYNKYLLSPVDYLEACEYNKYALQMSAYGLMAEMTYGVKVGSLTITYIFWNENKGCYDMERIPMPYLRQAVIDIYNHKTGLKPIPF